jgi:hypothetical protein
MTGIRRTTDRGPGTGGLARYVVSATLARGADGGAAVGLVLLAMAPAAQLARPALTGGLLATCLSAPHVVGPVLARRLDRAGDGRYFLAAAFTLYGLALAAASLAVGHAPVWVAACLAVVAGTCGPLLTGGLSSRLAGLVRPDQAAQRRAQGWDAVSYGIGGSAGPAAVAALAGAAGPVPAMLMLSGAALLAAVVTATLPAGNTAPVPARSVLRVRRTLRLIAVSGPLRRVGYVTMVTSVPGGAVAVVAVALGRQLDAGAVSGAVLAAAFGIGNFLGSLVVTAVPLRGEPERLVTRYAAILGVACGLCAVVPDYRLAVVAFGLAGAANAPLFAATLAARSAYSPPGARAQVFVSMAGLKVAMAAVGAAAAGAFAGLGPRVLLSAGAALVFAVVAATAVDRRHSPVAQHPPDRGPAAEEGPEAVGDAPQPHELRR